MDSFTLFAHIVRYVGSNMCSRAHVELQSLGVLPKASLENNPPLQQHDADVRTAFAIWCGLSIDPTLDAASKSFFRMVSSGRAQVPVAPDGENFVLKLAEILRLGPIVTNVNEVHIGPAFVTDYGLNCLAHVIYNDGTGTKYQTGEPLQWTGQMGTHLDDLKLLAIHRDLRETPRLWPDEAIPQTASLRFVGGLIQIENNESRNEIPSRETSSTR